MNIFVLDKNLRRCAQAHCDQHVVKMILESVQILCTVLNQRGFKTPYRSTHPRHPCVRWAGESYDNFRWLQNLARALNAEYRYRFDKDQDHKSMDVLNQIKNQRFPRRGRTPFPQAMPTAYKVPGDAVAAYRNFYRTEKSRFARWTKRPVPGWMHIADLGTGLDRV